MSSRQKKASNKESLWLPTILRSLVQFYRKVLMTQAELRWTMGCSGGKCQQYARSGPSISYKSASKSSISSQSKDADSVPTSIIIQLLQSVYYSRNIQRKGMKKDEQSLLRMNFLIQAARLYSESLPQYSSHFLFDFIQMSEKKMIRIDRRLKRKIDTRSYTFKKGTYLGLTRQNREVKMIQEKMIQQKIIPQKINQQPSDNAIHKQ